VLALRGRHDSLGSGQDATPCGYRADAQQIICSRLTPDQLICLREGKNTQNLELQYKWEETMLISALVLGILGGLFGLLIGLFGYTLGGIAGLGGLQALSMAIPIVSIVGGAMAKAKPIAAGSLMILSSVGMFCVFGFNFFTAIPLVLSAVGGLLAIAGMSEATQVVSTQPAPPPASPRPRRANAQSPCRNRSSSGSLPWHRTLLPSSLAGRGYLPSETNISDHRACVRRQKEAQ